MARVKIKATDGSDVEFEDKLIGAGGMKDVFFAPDKSQVVAFFRNKQDFNARDRLENIVGLYRDRILTQEAGNFWKDYFCWPTKILEHKGLLGLVAPVYAKHFFFEIGSVKNDFLGIKGKEKEGKWFASVKNRKFLENIERGNLMSYIKICWQISRAVRRLHAAGLAHSDLSYKNVLIDPKGKNASIIDIDGLVVPGKYPPDVVGTPDFIAPEVMKTQNLKLGDPAKSLPRIETDRHALAVLIYMYLFFRHPLRGRKSHDMDDPQRDENLSMGERALFIENSRDDSNRPRRKWLESNYGNKLNDFLPWVDVDIMPYNLSGPYLKKRFDDAFIEGIHNPSKRPTADDWERELAFTWDLLQPCSNPGCDQKWFIFDNSTKPTCPYCKTKYKGLLPVLNLYSKRGKDKFESDNQRLMVYSNQYLYMWHVNKKLFPNEKLKDEQKKPVGYFVLHNGKWVFVNQKLNDLEDLTEKKKIPINSMLVLEDGKQILLSREDGGRCIVVQMVRGE